MTDTKVVLSSVALFASASPEQLDRVVTASFPRRLRRGQVLFTEGEASDHLFVVVTGHLKVLVGSERGETLVLTLVGPGEAIGELSMIDGLPRSAGAEAVGDGMVPIATARARSALTSTGFMRARSTTAQA